MSDLLSRLDQQKFVREWADKFDALASMANTTRTGVASIAAAIGQNFAALKANLDAHSDAVEQLDVYNQIWAKMFLCLLERIVEIHLAMLGEPEEPQRVKDLAKEDFQALLQECKARVLEEREVYIKTLRAQAEDERRMATESETVKEAFQDTKTLISTPGGDGSDIPDGAEIFGG